eukprot:12924788-Prorocentrum_lima.AAC.1
MHWCLVIGLRGCRGWGGGPIRRGRAYPLLSRNASTSRGESVDGRVSPVPALAVWQRRRTWFPPT